MSKTYSGLYAGTIGSRPCKGSERDLQVKVTDWAQVEADKLEKISRKKRRDFNTATVVYDESTGNYYYGRNGGIDIYKEPHNPVLYGDATHPRLLPKTSPYYYGVDNCAEIHAVNRALNSGAKLKNLRLYTIHAISASKFSFGDKKMSCQNCAFTLKGRIKENYTGWEV